LKKKNQKTFIHEGQHPRPRVKQRAGAKFKSFLLLFFKKEDFLPLMAFLPAWAVTKKEPQNFCFLARGKMVAWCQT